MNRILLLFLVILEIFSQLYWVHYKSELASVVYMLCGLATGLSCIHYKPPKNKTTTPVDRIWTYLILATLVLMLFSYAKDFFVEVPLDYHTADMLPIIQTMCERFINGMNPYTIIPEIWGGMQPIYLPRLWMPFIPASLLEFDLRWMCLSALAVCLLLIYSKYLKGLNTLQSLTFIPAFLIILSIISIDNSLITMTQEPIVILWYIAMSWSFINNHPRLFGVFSALSLLSRYALAPWLLMIGAILFWDRKRFFFRAVISGTITTLTLLFVSNANNYTEVFLGLSDNYLTDIANNRGKYEGMINSGLGLAKFLDYNDLNLLHAFMKWVAIISPICLGLYYKLREKYIPLDQFGIASLKVYLVLFYNLIIMPYSYLFYTSSFLSLFILIMAFSSVQYKK